MLTSKWLRISLAISHADHRQGDHVNLFKDGWRSGLLECPFISHDHIVYENFYWGRITIWYVHYFNAGVEACQEFLGAD